MDRQYETSNQGIAAYMITQGYEMTSAKNATNKNGKACVKIEFNIDAAEGRRLGDAFFDGEAVGNLKEFHDASFAVRQKVWETKNA